MKNTILKSIAAFAAATILTGSMSVFADDSSDTDINLVINKPASATSELGNYSASRVTDNDITTRWATIDGAPQSIEIESKDILQFNRIVVNEYTTDGTARIQDFTVEYSPDRIDWYPCEIDEISEPVKVSENSVKHTININKVSGKGIRVNITEASAPPSIWEIEVYHDKISHLGMVIGNYVEFGSYNGEGLLWRVVEIDDNGALLVLDEAIPNPMEYDAAGGVTTGSHSRNTSNSRIDKGSDFWNDSNIKDWLNSDLDRVVYTCGNEPSYATKSGFLKDFTQNEKLLLKSVEQTNILNILDKDLEGVTGSASHKFVDEVMDVVQNYDSAYKNTINDKIFLPDVKQVYSMYANRTVLGEQYYIPKVNGSYVYSWVRTPVGGNNGNDMRIISTNGSIGSSRANTTSPQIYARPMMYIDEINAQINGGTGEKQTPYTVTYAPDLKPVIEFNKTKIESGDTITATVSAEVTAHCYMALYRNGILEKVAVKDIDSITNKTELSLEMPEDVNGCSLRLFVWGDNQRPLATAVLAAE